jgi:hypothetical protein
MQVYPYEHNRREEIQIIFVIILIGIKQVIPYNRKNQRKDMWPGKPVYSGRRYYKENYHDSNKDVAFVGLDYLKEQIVNR